jgi:hypothetical protein
MLPSNDARARAIVARLSEGTATADEVFAAFEELDHLPPEIVRDALEPWTGPAPDLERLDDTMRRAHRLPLRTPRLATLGSARDADVLDLGDLAEQQLRIAGRTWDGQDLDAFERLDGERDDSFAGSLERRVLGEGKEPLYDVILFGDGAGVIFRANTVTVLGVIADHRVETTDRPARLALEVALGGPPAKVEHVEQEQLALPILEAAPVEVEEEAPKPKKKVAAKKKAAAAEKPKKKAAVKKKTAAEKPEKAAKPAAKPKKKAAAKTATKKKKAAASDD